MKHSIIAPNFTVEEVLAHYPQVIPVFFRHQMACIGCAMAPFETLTDVTRTYGLPLDRFLDELEQTIQSMEEKS